MTPADLPTYMRDEGSSLGEAEWQPIETAPIGGEQVLVYVPRRLGDIIVQAGNSTGTQWWARNMGDVQPTHWMPLPLSPAQRTTIPLPDRERTAGRDIVRDAAQNLIDNSPVGDDDKPYASDVVQSELVALYEALKATPDIVDKREDRSARASALEEAARLAWDALRCRACGYVGLWKECCDEMDFDSPTKEQIAKAIRELKPRAADVTSPTPPDSSLVTDALTVVNEQADDEGLWFIPKYISEDYLQRALRRLHSVVEKSKP